MSLYDIRALGPLKLPYGISVGDEFRIAGKVRITAISEELVDITSLLNPDPSYAPGERTIGIGIISLEPTE